MAQSDNHIFLSEGDLNSTEARKKFEQLRTHDETIKWLSEDTDCFYHQALSTPCLQIIERNTAEGFSDLSGKKYLDFHGNNVHLLGFNHPNVIRAIRDQIDQLTFCTRRYTNIPSILLAKKLIEKTKGVLGRVLFAPSGSLAVGIAIKMARKITGRHKVISLWDSFHGASLDAISISGEAIFRKDAGPLLPGVHLAPPPDPTQCIWKCGDTCNSSCASYISYILEKEGDIAAVIAEPVRSVPVIPPKNYWKQIEKACRKYGALLIFDEIPNGLGRTGSFFTYQHYDVQPDMVLIGKALGGGVFPLAAIIGRASFNDKLTNTALGHYTHEKNPLAATAALALIHTIEAENYEQIAIEKGKYLHEKLSFVQQKHPIIKEIRSIGMLLGVVLDQSSNPTINAAEFIMYHSLEQGLNFKITQGNILSLCPPLVIGYEDLDRAVAILQDAFEALALQLLLND